MAENVAAVLARLTQALKEIRETGPGSSATYFQKGDHVSFPLPEKVESVGANNLPAGS